MRREIARVLPTFGLWVTTTLLGCSQTESPEPSQRDASFAATFALGLFAVFGVLRYRTESLAIKDLTHLYVVIGIALINALSNKKISLAELLIVNGAIAGAVSPDIAGR